MARLEPTVRLKRLARLLHAERDPHYVRLPLPPLERSVFPSEGWYWVPSGGNQVQFMGRDAFDAHHFLMRILEAELELELEEKP